MKGILICGGTGSRLKPLTDITNKSLLPVYDKPLIHYPLDILLRAGITDIAVITGPEHMDQITKYLGSGTKFGCTFAFKVQEKPGGIAQALGLAKEFVDGDSCCVILGDNVFFDDLTPEIKAFQSGAHLFLKEVADPERFGVASITKSGKRKSEITILSVEEKPQTPQSNLAVTGCYLYDHRCFDIIANLQPSARGELEITAVSDWYVKNAQITATILQDEWIDAGTFESLFRTAQIVRSRRTSYTCACMANVILTDAHGTRTGTAEIVEAHTGTGKLHLAFSVFVFDTTRKRVLLQRRAAGKMLFAGLWANTCCSHPREQETAVEAGQRRLQEEMGFVCPLSQGDSFVYRAEDPRGRGVEHEYDTMLIGTVDPASVVIHADPKEVMEWKWMDVEDLRAAFLSDPDSYAPWLKMGLGKILGERKK